MWSLFAVTLGFGLICLGLTVMYIFKRRNVKAEILRCSTMDDDIKDDLKKDLIVSSSTVFGEIATSQDALIRD